MGEIPDFSRSGCSSRLPHKALVTGWSAIHPNRFAAPLTRYGAFCWSSTTRFRSLSSPVPGLKPGEQRHDNLRELAARIHILSATRFLQVEVSGDTDEDSR